MAFDKSLDKEIFAEQENFDTTRIKVGIYSYDGGEKKLQISRENVSQQGVWSFAKVGRMTKEEAEGTLPIFKKALEHM